MTPDQLDTLTCGVLVGALETTWQYAGRIGDDAVLVRNLKADLSKGFTGHPQTTRQITAVATGHTHPVSLVDARHIES